MNGLSEIPPASFYRLSMGTVPNPQDARTAPAPNSITGGSRRRTTKRNMKYKLKHKYKKGSGRSSRSSSRSSSRNSSRNSRTSRRTIVNYAGRQIGHLSQRQWGNGNKYNNKYGRTLDARRRRQTRQSGGTTILPSDANLVVSSIGSLLQSGVAALKGVDGPANPLPFSDKLYERNL
jgi:hypothetical protein